MIRLRVVFSRAAFAVLFIAAGCGGGGGFSPPNPTSTLAPVAPVTGTPSAVASGAPSTATPNPAHSSAPGSTASPGTTPATGAPSTASPPPATPTPSSSPVGTQALPAPTAPPDDPAHTNVVPPVPTTGCRAGQTYNVYVDSGPTDLSPTGTLEAFTVFEPTSLCAGGTYPLIFNGPGFGGSRTSAAGSFQSFNDAGYGVISVDEAGEGEDGGKIRVMDPDQEGVMLLAVMNWAQAKLPWLAYGPTNDGLDAHEPVYGSDGGSYGGMYQFMLLNIDKRHRLRAITPQITPADLNFSLFPGGAIKTMWDATLFGLGTSAGSGASRGNFDPFVRNGFVNDFAANQEDSGLHDFFAYHSADYFCNGQSVATNGGAGTAPQLPPAAGPPKINALIYIGSRDTLFDFNNGYQNYRCLQRGGGDVRLLSYQSGHNSQLQAGVNGATVVPDPYVALFYPNNDSLDTKCGMVDQAAAELAWFNQYLKGQSGAASFVPTTPCISLAAGDAVTLPRVPTYAEHSTTAYPFSLSNVVAGAPPDSGTPSTVQNVAVLYTAGPRGDVVAGIPHVVLDVAPVAVAANVPTVYVGLGVLHAANAQAWDLMDNEVMPLVGTGHFDEDLVGGGIRLQPGDQLGLLVFGLSSQFAATGSTNATKPVAVPVNVSGTVYIPDIGAMPANI